MGYKDANAVGDVPAQARNGQRLSSTNGMEPLVKEWADWNGEHVWNGTNVSIGFGMPD